MNSVYNKISQEEILQDKVEELILFIFKEENIIKIKLEEFYEIFVDYCDTNLSIFYIRCYLLNLVCRDLLLLEDKYYKLIVYKEKKRLNKKR